MNIIRWREKPWFEFDPFSEITKLKSDMDRLFGVVRSVTSHEPMFPKVFPALNLTHDEHNFYIRTELPGIKAESLDINTNGVSISIKGERIIQEEGENVSYHRSEREGGYFKRVLSLPAKIEPDKIEAKYKDGILTIVLPKATEAKPKKITVKAQ
ncbi:MAG: Hsp20/alpha crystallin family protein [Thermodesulfobacteriota bacterium]|nr:Hsp20/alpha crystallin family protein [Thermodesulfobacteriota bacterium]